MHQKLSPSWESSLLKCSNWILYFTLVPLCQSLEVHHNVYQTKISDKRVKLQHFLRYIVSSKINKLQFEIIFCSACHLVTTYSSWQKSFDKCLKQYKKTSNWQPLSSLLVIFSAATFGSKSVGSSSSTFVPMGYWDLSSFEAGIKKPKWKFFLLIAL